MTEKVLFYSIIGISVSLGIGYLTRATGKSVTKSSIGTYNLRMNKLYGYFGVIGLIFGLLFLIILPLSAEPNEEGVWLNVLLLLVIFWGSGIYCLMYYRNHKVTFDDQFINVTNVYGKIGEINWNDIRNIKFNIFTGLLSLETKHNSVKIHQHLVGLQKFMEYIEKNTEWTSKDLKIPTGK